MLWDIQHLTGPQWDDALMGNYETKAPPYIAYPKLKYYYNDAYCDLPTMRSVVLGPKEEDDNYNSSCHTVLAMAEFRQFHAKVEPHVWSMPYITVHPDLQKRGVARQLFQESLAWLKRIDPDAQLHRTANSDSGQHWQHVADTELFAARMPWRQGGRMPEFLNDHQREVHMTDFDSPTARMCDALQRKCAPHVQDILHAYPGHDWSAPNNAFVHPLHTAILYLPSAVDLLLSNGASPTVEAGWIGYALLTDPNAFDRWLDCFAPEQKAEAFVLAVSGHSYCFKEHSSWDKIPHESKEKAYALIELSCSRAMRYLTPDIGKNPQNKSWRYQDWNVFGQSLNAVTTTLQFETPSFL